MVCTPNGFPAGLYMLVYRPAAQEEVNPQKTRIALQLALGAGYGFEQLETLFEFNA